MFGGGGFFGGGAKQTQTTDNRVDQSTNADNATAPVYGVGSRVNITTTDGGAVKDALLFGSDALSFSGKAIDASTKAISDTANLIYDGSKLNSNTLNNLADKNSKDINSILSANQKQLQTNIDAAYEGMNKNLDFSGKLVDKTFVATADTNKKIMDSAKYFLDANYKENSANRVMLSDAQSSLANAWQKAGDNTMMLSSEFMKTQSDTQNEAINAILKGSSSAQSAALSAMNGVFESAKSSSERVIDNSLKYIVFGVIGLFALPFITKVFTKSA